MNYHESLDYLDRLGNEVLTMNLGLDRIRALLAELGDPQSGYPAVLIAGTNGKGSVARLLASMATCCGLRTGLFTSPHLIRVEERIVVDGRPISAPGFATVLSTVVKTLRERKLAQTTFFETLTAAAFLHFAQRSVELAVLEVGLGGRLDSTNVVEPLVSILTSIGIDHGSILGDSIEAITGEKLGILRAGRPAVVAPQRPAVQRLIQQKAAGLQVPLIEIDRSQWKLAGHREGRYRFDWEGERFQLGTFGRMQVENAVTALQAARQLADRMPGWSPQRFRAGVESARSPGVVQRLREEPLVFADGGHNPDAAARLAEFVRQHVSRPRSLVFGIMSDKEVGAVLERLRPLFESIFLTQVDSPRAAAVADLHTLCPEGQSCADVADAYRAALGKGGPVVVTGSFYVVGEVARLERHPVSPMTDPGSRL